MYSSLMVEEQRKQNHELKSERFVFHMELVFIQNEKNLILNAGSHCDENAGSHEMQRAE